jgi:hypothetical protein
MGPVATDSLLVSMQRCNACGEDKAVTDFYVRRGKKGTRHGRRYECKRCSGLQVARWQAANPERKKQNERDHYHRNRDHFLDRDLRTKYRMTLDEFHSRLKSQGGGCALCGTKDPRGNGKFHVDHNHTTGDVRALLCHSCNTGLGLLGDTVAALEKAVAYLKRFS